MATIRTGTAGWTDPSLIRCGRFYPPTARDAESKLRYYASKLSMVEVDSTHYVPLARRNAALWAARTPASFVFQVKAHGLLTGHPCRPQALPLDLHDALPARLKPMPSLLARDIPPVIVDELALRFVDALVPLIEARKLSAVLMQFPPWLEAGRESARIIAHATKKLAGLPLAIELRHRSWLADGFRLRTIDFLARNNLSLVCTEGPPSLPSTLPVWPLVTNPSLSVLRLHGQRREGDPPEQRRSYGPESLARWSEFVKQLSEQSASVHVVFANGWRDCAVRDAQALATALSLPEPVGEWPEQGELPMF